ncbi:hypothetical protein GLAREA_09294 [Glarea lozoyensis ATCC 20868]|uniref:Uncharacterized protein n=1 Tax=Glarea lozoyensis (strain ATCC 20868 / MF5171) TaxID=1116229 RepID=S3DYW6_GLAL2|nr:uncharacterized protein GLAREA_09294 [Glarea lozoyensis ATCC 20868]EPE37131.1 hypothetical protein GLAREA_09294 [Glarea lozoyensis ATCC 20868]
MKINTLFNALLLWTLTAVSQAQTTEPIGNCTIFSRTGDYTYTRYSSTPSRISAAEYCVSRRKTNQSCPLVADGDLQLTFNINSTELRDSYWPTKEGTESFLHRLIRNELNSQGKDFNRTVIGVIDTVMPLEPGTAGYINFYPLLLCAEGTMKNCTGGIEDGLGIEACAPVATVDGGLKIMSGRTVLQNVSSSDVENYTDPFAGQSRGGGVHSLVLNWSFIGVAFLGVLGATIIGVSLPQLSYTANQVFPIAKLNPHEVRVLHIKYRSQFRKRLQVPASAADEVDGEIGAIPPIQRRTTLRDTTRSMLINFAPPQPIMKAKTMAPHNILCVASSLLTMGLLVWAVVIGDGPATIAIVLLSAATSLFCAASLWSLPTRPFWISGSAHSGDVVIRTKNGAFLIVQCNQEIARELYYGSEEVRQAITRGFGISVGSGTIVFMVAVILLGNASWTMQAALAVTYLLLNAVFWFVALIPSTTHWDFPMYEIQEIVRDNVKDLTQGVGSDPLTRSLWQAIFVTKSTDWVKRSGATPGTTQWENWLNEAYKQANVGNRMWNPEAAFAMASKLTVLE